MWKNKAKSRQKTNPAAFHHISHITQDQINRKRRQSVLKQPYDPKPLFSCDPDYCIQKQRITRLPVRGHGQITVCIRVGSHPSLPQKSPEQSPKEKQDCYLFSSSQFPFALHLSRNLPIRYFPFAIPNSFHQPGRPLFSLGMPKYSSKHIQDTSSL